MNGTLGIRWTIGDVNPAGFEALRLSVHGARRLFGEGTEYRVYVNTISADEARRRVGPTPADIQWLAAEHCLPEVLRPFVDEGMAEGVAWKLLPLRAFPDRFELSLDNDVILWAMPPAVERWLASPDPAAALLAEDVSPGHGRFAGLCGPEPRNSGIRGFGPRFDFEAALACALKMNPARLESELDEQGLQVAALTLHGTPLVVATADVTICSPFHPHTPALGKCGAHFVGLNTRKLPWSYYGEPATQVRLAHWMQHRLELYRRVGLGLPDAAPASQASCAGSTDRPDPASLRHPA